jgi:hypothetical protein
VIPIERVRWSAAVVVMMAVSSRGHIEATMVAMPVSLTDPNSDAADPDVGDFRNDHWFADGQRTGKCRHRQKRNKKESKCNILHGTLLCWDVRRPDAR